MGAQNFNFALKWGIYSRKFLHSCTKIFSDKKIFRQPKI